MGIIFGQAQCGVAFQAQRVRAAGLSIKGSGELVAMKLLREPLDWLQLRQDQARIAALVHGLAHGGEQRQAQIAKAQQHGPGQLGPEVQCCRTRGAHAGDQMRRTHGTMIEHCKRLDAAH